MQEIIGHIEHRDTQRREDNEKKKKVTVVLCLSFVRGLTKFMHENSVTGVVIGEVLF